MYIFCSNHLYIFFSAFQFTKSKYLIIINLLKMNSHTSRVRKDINHLKPYEELRFWWCFKYLQIMKPIQISHKSKLPKRRYMVVNQSSKEFQYIYPPNRYDQMVASHVASCQHRNIYFSYYHRHLLIYLQIALQQAQEELLQTSIPFGFKYICNFDQMFLKVSHQYKEICKMCKKENNGIMPDLSIHYWNPMDYRKNIDIPSYFRGKNQLEDSQFDAMNILYLAVNKCHFGEFNIQTRWYKLHQTSKNSQKNPQEFSLKGSLENPFKQTIFTAGINDRNLSDKISSIEVQKEWFQINSVISEYSPHSKIEDRSKFEKYIAGNIMLLLNAAQIRQYRQYTRPQIGNENIPRGIFNINQFVPKEVNLMFGGGQYHYFSPNEIQDSKYSSNLREYNSSQCHYLKFCQSLFVKNTNFKCFLSQLQVPHNSMHNTLGFPMRNASLSPLNPLFFLYHAWIDLMLEMKIRIIKSSSSQYQASENFSLHLKQLIYDPSKKQQDDLKDKSEEQKKMRQRFWDIVHFAVKQKVNLGEKKDTYKLLPVQRGQYLCIQWFNVDYKQDNYIFYDYDERNPDIQQQDLQYAFAYRQLMINEQNLLRKSTQLNKLYENYLQKRKYLNTFNFNYNYHIEDLNEYGIPQYLYEIIEIQRKDRLVERQLFINKDNCWANQKIFDCPSFKKDQFTIQDCDDSIFYKVLVTYPANIQSSNISVGAQFNLKKFHHSHYLNENQQYYFGSLAIHSKERLAGKCPLCIKPKQIRYLWENYVQKDVLKQIFNIVYPKKSIVYENGSIDRSLDSFIILKTKNFKVVPKFLKGAQQIQVQFKWVQSIKSLNYSLLKQKTFFKLIMYRVSEKKTENDCKELQPQQSLEKQGFWQFKPSIDFARYGSDNSKFMYDKFIVELQCLGKQKTYEVPIKNYHKNLKYKINVDKNLDIQIIDMNYQANSKKVGNY